MMVNGEWAGERETADQGAGSGGFSPADVNDAFHTFSVYGLGSGHSYAEIGAGTFFTTVTLDANTNGTKVSTRI